MLAYIVVFQVSNRKLQGHRIHERQAAAEVHLAMQTFLARAKHDLNNSDA